VLDGGLATSLEARGYDLNDDLWSAKVLLEDPDVIQEVHRDFLRAGADCITTATYQATFPGFSAKGLSDTDTVELLLHSVDLAVKTRDSFWAKTENRKDRLRPIVAASIGPYGAFLADGSEYTGDYIIDATQLHDFHEKRWHILADSGADLLACETIPSELEGQVLLNLLQKTQNCRAWISFSCCDGAHLRDGSRLEHMAELCNAEPQVAAVGINCTAPEYISSLIREIQKASSKPIIVYPNSGEDYDASRKIWTPASDRIDWEDLIEEWKNLGVSGIGGCCRFQPDHIAKIRDNILPAGTAL